MEAKIKYKLIKLILFTILLILLLSHFTQAATIIIYGKGGVILIPHTICPKESKDKCAEVIIDIPVPNPQKGFEIIIKDNEGNLYQGLLAEPLKENVKEMQGKDIKLIKIEHTK